MKCEIISIGNELLIGDTVNTNASWLGSTLTECGVDVCRIITVGDDLDLIKNTLQESLSRADLVITTGGLGPTHDDITKKAVAELYEVDLALHEPTLEFVKDIFKKRKIPFSKSNYHQAEVPVNCEVLFNKQGTAPGMWFEERSGLLAVLPGVPYEMKHLTRNKVLPKLKKPLHRKAKRFSKYIVTAGIGESTLSDKVIGDLGNYLNDDLSIAYLPSPQGAKIRISAHGSSLADVENEIDRVAKYIYKQAGDYIIGEGKDYTISQAVGERLKKQELTLAAAESCTGGLLADTVTNIPGSSGYMVGGIVAYADEIKVDILGVEKQSIGRYGAVSKEVALEMAEGVAQRFEADIGISTTGIAGPGGGTEEKPVGTVWIGYWSKDRHFALKPLFTNDRLINKERSVAVALEVIRRTVDNIDIMPYGLKPHFS